MKSRGAIRVACGWLLILGTWECSERKLFFGRLEWNRSHGVDVPFRWVGVSVAALMLTAHADALCQRKIWDQCREEPLSDGHHRGLFGINAIGPGKQVITKCHIDIPRARDDSCIWIDEILTRDSDPHLIKYATNRINGGLKPVTQRRRKAIRHQDAFGIYIRTPRYATPKYGSSMKQWLALSDPQIVRSMRPDHFVATGMSIDAFTDKLLQEAGHGAACPVKSRP